MKRALSLLLVVMMCIGLLAGCGAGETEAEKGSVYC